MKAFILAAGLGTRLRPWTLHHPKALVPVGGVPMLERVILTLKKQGFDYIVINVHHFADQIKDFLKSKDFGVNIVVSDESDGLLDTGGGLAKAAPLLMQDTDPVLVHNVDIISNAPLKELMDFQRRHKNLATLLVSDRNSSRKLFFDENMSLTGWKNLNTGITRPDNFVESVGDMSYAFSGIHAVSYDMLRSLTTGTYPDCFPIMDYYLSHAASGSEVKGLLRSGLEVIDIGKPESLTRADQLFK